MNDLKIHLQQLLNDKRMLEEQTSVSDMVLCFTVYHLDLCIIIQNLKLRSSDYDKMYVRKQVPG